MVNAELRATLRYMTTEPYSETKGSHQYPVQAISAWQEWNDLSLDFWWSAQDEKDARYMEREYELQGFVDYSCQ